VCAINVRTRIMSGRRANRSVFISLLTDDHKSALWEGKRTEKRKRRRQKTERTAGSTGMELRNNIAGDECAASNAPDLISAFFTFDVTRPEFKWVRYNAVTRSCGPQPLLFIFSSKIRPGFFRIRLPCSYSASDAPFLAPAYISLSICRSWMHLRINFDIVVA